jgi:Ala-tRNA(Pro) deacylase
MLGSESPINTPLRKETLMATATWIKNMLEQHGVRYEELHHPVAFTAQEVAEAEHTSGHRVAKVVIVIANGLPVELILPASRRVVMSRVRKLLGADDLRLASEAEMERIFTDCVTGATAPLRHWKDVPILMDASMSNLDDMVFQAGTHEDAIRLKLSDWLALVKPRVEFFSQPERASSGAAFTDRHHTGSTAQRRAANRAARARRESGQPGGGQGRVDVVGLSGVYPVSGPDPTGDAPLRTPAQFVHGQRDQDGREVEGGSGLTYVAEGILVGGEPTPSSSPAAPTKKTT